jgi:Saxitoxin biosynthesis operon protein SxtJ
VLTPNWNPDRKTLRQFAGLWLVFLVGVGLFRAWRGGGFEPDHPFGFEGPWLVPIVLWGMAVVAGVPGLFAPTLIRPVYVGLMALSFPIGWVISHALLMLVYFGLFSVFGLVFRLVGRDRLGLRLDRRRQTYWMDREPRSNPSRYFRLS